MYKWILFCRFFGTLKKYVCNKSKPEESIAKAYIAEEYMTFCARYLDEMKERATTVD